MISTATRLHTLAHNLRLLATRAADKANRGQTLMSWIRGLFNSSRPSALCPECGGPITEEAVYCKHCSILLIKSTWLPSGGFNWCLATETLADLLTYPTPEYPARVQACTRSFTRVGEEVELMTRLAAAPDNLIVCLRLLA